MTVFALIGFGELGSALAASLTRSGDNVVRAYTPQRSDPRAAAALEQRLQRAGAWRSASLQDALAGADAVLCVAPSSASRTAAESAAKVLGQGAYYVDLTAARVAEKQDAARLVGDRGGLYADGAVLGTVAASGPAVPIVVSGPGARGFSELVAQDGLVVEALDAPVGHATLVKLLRSVYMKGRDALVVEMMLAARRYGLDEQVAQSIAGPGERVPFPALADRVLRALAVHAERRADELLASSEVVGAAGVDPVISRAGSEVLRRLGELQLREAFGQERPASAAEVLAAIDERSARQAPAGPPSDAPRSADA